MNCPDTGQRVKQPLKLPYFKMINSDYDCNDTNHDKKNNKNYNNDNANILLRLTFEERILFVSLLLSLRVWTPSWTG